MLARMAGPDQALTVLQDCEVQLVLSPHSKLVCELLRVTEKRQRWVGQLIATLLNFHKLIKVVGSSDMCLDVTKTSTNVLWLLTTHCLIEHVINIVGCKHVYSCCEVGPFNTELQIH